MARGNLNGNYCNTANHASLHKPGLRALRTRISPLWKPRSGNLIPITSPTLQSFQAGRYSFPFPSGKLEGGEGGSWTVCSYLSHHINTFVVFDVPSKGEGNLLATKYLPPCCLVRASLSCSLSGFSGYKKERR